MPTCTLCTAPFIGRGNVCAPLGESGDRCCDDCNVTRVFPERLKRQRSDDSESNAAMPKLHVLKRIRRTADKSSKHDVDSDTDDEYVRDPVSGAYRPLTPKIKANAVPIEVPDAADSGIAFQNRCVNSASRLESVAVKPPLPTTRAPNIVVDIVLAVDDTVSMQGTAFSNKASGQAGMLKVFKNFCSIVEAQLGQLTRADEIDDPEFAQQRRDDIKATTFVRMFKFGEKSSEFKGMPTDFFALSDKDAVDRAMANASKDLTCEQRHTDIGDAVAYAARIVRDRFAATREADKATDTMRIPCFLLLTDGSVTRGCTDVAKMLHDADATVAEVPNSQSMLVFGVGLGDGTDPRCLSKLCRDGFWAHSRNAHDPSDAFSTTLGSLLNTLGAFAVEVAVEIERGGALVEDSLVVTTKRFGLLTARNHRGRILKVEMPSEMARDDVLRITTTFATAPTQPFTSRIAVATLRPPTPTPPRPFATPFAPVPTVSRSISDETNRPPVDSAPEVVFRCDPEGLSEGLFEEVEQLTVAATRIKDAVLKGDRFGGGLAKPVFGSTAVRSFVQSASDLFESTLSTPGSTTVWTDWAPSPTSTPCVSAMMYPTTAVMYDSWELFSSFSQLDA
jgi:hypothetical protein